MDPLRGLRRSRDETYFRFRITSDANEESGVGQVVDSTSGPTEDHFKNKNYGTGLSGIGVVLMCRDPRFNFKRRIRLAKKDKRLYMDIMLDLDQMKYNSPQARREIILQRIAKEVPEVLAKYQLTNFDRERFVFDLHTWLASIK
jgi:hypothetical protein